MSSLGNRDESEKSYFHFLLQVISAVISGIVQKLWITLYNINYVIKRLTY
jgi:hypothetical protein